MSYLNEALGNPRATPQTEPIPGSNQVPNNAGGYAWQADDGFRLDRFLILGTESGTYYVGQRDLTKENLGNVRRMLGLDGLRVVARAVEVSDQGLAPKNDPALLVLALASVDPNPRTREAAYAALRQVARTSTHLFDFLTFRQNLGGGWGRGLRGAVSDWYVGRSPDSLALQLVKYRQRNGWTHRDVLRKAHPDPSVTQPQISTLLAYAAGKGEGYPHALVQGYELASRSPSPKVTAGLVQEYGLPREAVLPEHLSDPEVWRSLLDNRGRGMPYIALLRNLATLTRVGVVAPLSEGAALVAAMLTNPESIRSSRVHPVQILAALKTYAQGRGERGGHTWKPVAPVIDALDSAFYESFQNVTPTGKAVLLGLDVSGSMSGTRVNGVPGLDCRSACGAMALVTAATEVRHGFVGFDTYAHPLSISPRQRLDDVVRLLGRTGGGGTDCSIPARYAEKEKLPVDAFVIYTDSESWYGAEHPQQAIERYRQRTGIGAKLVVVAMASNYVTIRKVDDPLSLDVVGFDPSAPQVISNFIAG